jgi:uncharacterized protein with HEPN domain
MSDATPPREWRFDVEDMLAFYDKALAYTRCLDRSTFAANPLRDDDMLWSIVGDDLVPLRAALTRLLAGQP